MCSHLIRLSTCKLLREESDILFQWQTKSQQFLIQNENVDVSAVVVCGRLNETMHFSAKAV